DLSSPISAFVRERCVVGLDYAETKDVLWTAWKAWCEEEGRSPGAKAIFGKNLHALGFKSARPHDGEKRVYFFNGIALGPGGPGGTSSVSGQTGHLMREHVV